MTLRGFKRMDTVFESALFDNDLGVCVRNPEGKVLQQNKLCLEICGDNQGNVCNVGCMELYACDRSRQWNNRGSHLYENSYTQGGFYDITLLSSNTHMITFLQPLSEKYKEALDYYKILDLTKREREILSYLIKGATNKEISDKIFISRATIKTHLNNFYKKVNDMDLELRYLPKSRLTS